LNLATYHYSGSIVGKLYTLEGDWLAKIPLEGLDQPEILKLANHKNRKIRYGVADRATPYDHPTVLLKLLGDADERVAKLAEAKMASFLGAQNLVAGSAIRLPSSPNWLAWPNAVPHPESFLLPDELLQQNFILFHKTGDGYCFQALEESTDFVKLVNQPLQLTRKKAAELAKIKLVYPANPRALQGPSVLALEVRSGAHRCQLWEADNGSPRGWTSFWDLQADQKIRPEDWLDPASPDMRILEYLQRNARHLASVGLTL
jgi:hypothetical protein